MKRVLIYYPKNKLGMSDFNPTDYSNLSSRVDAELGGVFPNFGNKVWLQAIVSEITTPECSYEFGYEDVPADYINNNYDCVLLPLANCFHVGWIPYLKKRTEYIKKIRIPVYVIACGIQAKSYDELDSLIEAVKEPAFEFIKSVYETGGEFALRGYFTAEFFERLGFKNAVVTGCPSLFQMGKNLSISNKKVNQDEFISTINGSFRLPTTKSDIEKSDFICQGSYGKVLYDPKYFDNNPFNLKKIVKYVKRGDFPILKAIANNKIQVFADIDQWMHYYTSHNVSFSFGSRIHGTVMPILSGVPSLIYSCDARTREMAEFFNIPCINSFDKQASKPRTLYEWYCETDYSEFNRTFAQKFDQFETFLKKCGLVTNINQNNIFMNRNDSDIKMPTKINKNEFDKLKKKLNRYEFLLNILEKKYNK